MAVKMRLRRMGSRNAPFYRVVIQDGRRAPTGRFIETIGWYDPKQEGNNFSINLDRVEYWSSSGAQPSDTVASLIKKARSLPVTGAVSEDEVSEEAVEAETAADGALEESTVEAVEEAPDKEAGKESEEA
ncbi:MAG TPA: 30S ribosomal protein S16 [Verrucomicrobia bacterium]|nr:30S ribosomal protein S16 [Verrucomicrobiota bacterium]|tara:strand:+ start:561 stop:950 length:390 start_codon:yes stop_codon:yes gene_type:complete